MNHSTDIAGSMSPAVKNETFCLAGMTLYESFNQHRGQYKLPGENVRRLVPVVLVPVDAIDGLFSRHQVLHDQAR
jgi:hypothetical protein